MVEKVATVILELHQGGGGHANTTCCQHQAKATTSDREMEEEQDKENKNQQGEASRWNDQTILYILSWHSSLYYISLYFLYTCQLPYPVSSTQPQACSYNGSQICSFI